MVMGMVGAGCMVLPQVTGTSTPEAVLPDCPVLETWVPVRPDGGSTPAGCAAGAGDILVLNTSGELFRFDPLLLAFTPVGTPRCAGAEGAEAFAMAQARDGAPWLVYTSGVLVRATSPSSCVDTGWVPGTGGMEVFAMAFAGSADRDDVLLVAGDTHASWGTRPARLGRVNPASLVLQPLCLLPSAPELTATGDGRAWAFFPMESPPRFRPVDPLLGTLGRAVELPTLSGTPTHWAVAFHGGALWIFLQRVGDFSTGVYRVDVDAPSPRAEQVVRHDTTLHVVGAAVSPCAPLR